MHILILDDIKCRHDTFDKVYHGDDMRIKHVYKYGEFCLALAASSWDLIHLDHDLGDFQDHADWYLDGKGNKQFFNGGHCVQKIIEKYISYKDKPKIIIHSINAVASPNMKHDLNAAGFAVTWTPYSEPVGDIDNDGV